MTINPVWKTWGTRTLVVLLIALVTYFATGKKVEPQIDAIPDEPIFGFGWVDDQEAVNKSLVSLEAKQGFRPYFAVCAANAMDERTDKAAVFLWLAEEKALGKRLGSWNQKSLGTCTSFGGGRAVQDTLLQQVVEGEAEWPGHEIATEPIYGGARIQIGSRLHGARWSGDGCVGAFVAEWLTTGGNLVRKQYDEYDLTTYSDAQNSYSIVWGRKGVPATLLPECKKHIAKSAALVSTTDELWAALGNGYAVFTCSNVGFDSPIRQGYCEPAGTWPHCMQYRARFVHPTIGRSFVVQNSWKNYLELKVQDPKQFEIQYLDGNEVKTMRLPEGCFAIKESAAARMLSARDSFAVSGVQGFPRRKLDWLINRDQPRKDLVLNQR